MSRHRLKQINRLAKVISFFTLLGVNIYLSCSYLKSIPESEYVSGMFLGVFILQLFVSILFVLTDLWLHSNVIRIIAVIMLAATCLFCLGYICYTNSNPIAFDIFFINARLCVHLFDDSSSNFAIDKKVINTERSLLNGVPFQTIINLEKQKYNE